MGAPYRETLAVTENLAAGGSDSRYVTYYRSLEDWPEREAVSSLTCPRFVFAGTEDEFVRIRIASLVSEYREELERMGWTVRLIDGFGHELTTRPDIVVPLLHEFLDPVLLTG